MKDNDPIEQYLDELLHRLRGTNSHVRRVLSETEDHLRSSIDAEVERGTSLADAQRNAIAKFGSARKLAHELSEPVNYKLTGDLRFELFRTITWLVVVGFIAIGASGVLSLIFGSAWGWKFVAGDAKGVTYSAARCRQYVELFPKPLSCAQAALNDHFGEVVDYRMAAGILGLIGLAFYRWLRHRRPYTSLLPKSFAPTVGAAVFGVVGLILTINGVGELLNRDRGGPGADLSAGIVAVVIGVWFTRQVVRGLQMPSELAAVDRVESPHIS